MKILKKIAYVLLIIGGLNWGIYGLSGYDLVHVLFNSVPMIAALVYVLVGISAVYILVCRLTLCSSCKSDDECECEIKITTNSYQTGETKTEA